MNKLIYLLLTITFLLFASNVNAEPRGWILEVEVSRVVLVVNGGVNVRVTPELQGCTSQSGYGARYASILPNHPGLEKMYSALLAAQMSKTKVSLYLSDDKCTVGEMVFGGRY